MSVYYCHACKNDRDNDYNHCYLVTVDSPTVKVTDELICDDCITELIGEMDDGTLTDFTANGKSAWEEFEGNFLSSPPVLPSPICSTAFKRTS